MKENLSRIFSIGLAVVMFSVVSFAQQQPPQNDERLTVNAASSIYVVSVKAGGVNYVEGGVTVWRKSGKNGALLKGEQLEIGDKISTGANGRAEILLNPGSFARLAGNSTFEFASTALEDLQLKLTSGSAMFEVITDSEFTFAVNTPKARFDIVKSGVYRVDVLTDGAGRIEVWKGIASAGGATVKSGRQATFGGSQTSAATVAKFDRSDKDALEVWSKARAKEVAKFNARLESVAVRTSLMSSFYRTRWSLYNSYGLWIYSSFYGSYCFLPFGYGWNSPYGYNYPRDIWYYNLPPVIYNPPPPPPVPTTTQTVLSAGATIKGVRPGASGGGNGGNSEAEPIRALPPYLRVQKDIGGQFPSAGGENQPSELSSPGVYSPSRGQSSPPSSNSSPSSAAPAPPAPTSAPPPVISPSTMPTTKDN